MVVLNGGETGVRKIHYKDFAQETTGSNTFGALWEGNNTATWAIGLGNGSLPTTYHGLGYRYLNTPGGGVYNQKFTRTPAVKEWWDTNQTNTAKQNVHAYDFMFRANTTWTGKSASDGITFGYFIERNSTFQVTKGYRVRVDGSSIALEKNTGAGWGPYNVNSSNGTILSEGLIRLEPGQDYFCRMTYAPANVSWWGQTLPFQGSHNFVISDSFLKWGQGNVYKFTWQDVNETLNGTAIKRLSLGSYNLMDVEFDGITYSEGFMQRPHYYHVYDSICRFGSYCEMTFPKPHQEEWSGIREGDRCEYWNRSLFNRIDMTTGNLTEDYWKTVCQFDGVCIRNENDDRNNQAYIYLYDEFSAFTGQNKDEDSYTGGDTYYDKVVDSFPEFPGQKDNLFERMTLYPGIKSTQFNYKSVSNSYVWKGSKKSSWMNQLDIVNAWYHWYAPGGFPVSNLRPVETKRYLNLNNPLTGEVPFIIGTQKLDTKTDEWVSEFTGYHQNTTGAVIGTKYSNTTSTQKFGSVHGERIDVNLPYQEGLAKTQHIFDRQNQTPPTLDVYSYGWGLDLYPGCRVWLHDDSTGVNSSFYTCIEKEIFRTDNPPQGEPPCMVRHRFSYQEEPRGSNLTTGTLPRYVMGTARQLKNKGKERDYQARFWT